MQSWFKGLPSLLFLLWKMLRFEFEGTEKFADLFSLPFVSTTGKLNYIF